MLKEFKEFAMRGNVVDMAVGIVIGAAFGTIIKSLVSDIIMPPIGLLHKTFKRRTSALIASLLVGVFALLSIDENRVFFMS